MREKARLELLKKAASSQAEDQSAKKKSAKQKKQRFKNGPKGPFARKLTQAGIPLPPQLYVPLVLCIVLGAGYIASFLGIILSSCLSLFLLHYLLISYPDDRARKRKMRVVPLLPPFIDGIASALGTGFNIEAAITQAAQAVPNGLLRKELDRVVDALHKGFTVKEAIGLLKDRVSGKEITSLVVALDLFSSMGGHVLEPFRRLAIKIREQQHVIEKASRDLVIVKQAFKILFFLSIAAPGMLVMIQPTYLSAAYADALGRIVLQLGALMILIALVIFRRITDVKI